MDNYLNTFREVLSHAAFGEKPCPQELTFKTAYFLCFPDGRLVCHGKIPVLQVFSPFAAVGNGPFRCHLGKAVGMQSPYAG